MFVADLDRPWIDTPFLLQGFLIEDEEQLQQVRDCCQWVLIDPQRSTGDEYISPAKKAPERRDLGTEPKIQINRTAAPASSNTSGLSKSVSGTPQRNIASNADMGTSSNIAKPVRNNSAAGAREFAVSVRTGAAGVGGKPNASARNDAPDANSEKSGGGLRGLFGQLRKSAQGLFNTSQKDDFEGRQLLVGNIESRSINAS